MHQTSAGHLTFVLSSDNCLHYALPKVGAVLCHLLYLYWLNLEEADSTISDVRSALLRVHLLGHHVFPVFLRGARSGPWSDIDRCASGVRLVYLARHLVSTLAKLPMQN